MKVMMRSSKETGAQWFRGGEDIDYYSNGYEIVLPRVAIKSFSSTA